MDQHCLTGVSSITGVSGHQILTVKTLRNWASRLEHIDMLCMLTVEEARTLITAHNADALYAQEPGLVHDVLKFSPYLANLPSMPPSQKTLVRQRRTRRLEKRESAGNREVTCERCSNVIKKYEAFVRWSLHEPYCMPCIEADDELSGLNFEPMPLG